MRKQSILLSLTSTCFFLSFIIPNPLMALNTPKPISYKADQRYRADHLSKSDSIWVIKKQAYSIRIAKQGFRYSILKPDGATLLQAHTASGLVLLNSNVVDSRLISQNDKEAKFIVTNDIGIQAAVHLFLSDNYFKIAVSYMDSMPISGSIIARTQGLAPAYGLAM